MNKKPLIFSVCVFVGLAAADRCWAQSRLTCQSNDYRYLKCPAETSRGARLVEQLSRSECRLGETWGYDRDGIWVDRGCGAVFEVFESSSPGAPVGDEVISSCQQEALSEVRRRHGRLARAEFQGTPGSTWESNNEQRLTGSVRVWNGRWNYLATYSCRIDVRNGRILQLDLSEDSAVNPERSAVSVCQAAIQNRIRSDLGQGATVSFDDNPRVNSLARSENRVSGQGSFRTGYSTENFNYDCSVESRSNRLISAEYRRNPAGSLPPGGGFTGECDRYPVLYADDRFRGRSYDLEQSARDLHGEGFGDAASSICVPANWIVTLYQDSEFRGPTLVLEGPERIADLARDRPGGLDWGDRISSAEVFFRRPDPKEQACDRTPALFGDDSFRGKRVDVNQSISDLHSRGLGDNTSSLCVPSGWEITVFVDKRFGGSSLKVRGPASIGDLRRDRPDGGDWGDRISSVRVDRRPGQR